MDKKVEFDKLRKRAEDRLSATLKDMKDVRDMSLDTIIHELDVYQIELELQNEELQQAQQKLINSRDAYLHLYNNAPACYLLVDSLGKVGKANEAFVTTLGFNIHDINPNRSLADFIYYEDLNHFYSVFKAFYTSPKNYPFEVRLKSPTGVKHFQITGSRINSLFFIEEQFKEFDCLMILSDVTKLKTLEDELSKKNNAMKQLNYQLQEKVERETNQRIKNEQILFEQQKFVDMGQMINSIAHQWRQPLNALGLIFQILEQELADGEYDTIAERQKTAFELINHMSQTIDDFRNFFSPGKQKVSFNIIHGIFNTVKLIKSQMENYGIELELKCICPKESHSICTFDDLPDCVDQSVEIEGYPGEFKQIILNVIQNAKDAIIENHPGTGRIQFDIIPSETEIRLEIADDGGGIPETVLPKIFEPYFTTKEEGKGTGIGLYMAKTILTEHFNGTVAFENWEKGALCKISIPVHKNMKESLV